MSTDSIEGLGEFGLIDRLSSRLAVRPGVRLGIGDDGAVLDPLRQPIVTADALIEGVHFRLDWMTPLALGRKSMAVNVSDLAAMGGSPIAAFVCLGVPPHASLDVIDGIYEGMESLAAEFNFTIAGGDTVRSPGDLMISVTLIGEAMEGGPLLRSGARPGDVLLVSGTLGDSAAGLQLLLLGKNGSKGDDEANVIQHHLDPQPRLTLMEALLRPSVSAVHASLDISDGLAGDCRHLATRSGLRAVIETEKIPISPACSRIAAQLAADPLDWALTGGEDYELLLAMDPASAPQLVQVAREIGIPLTPIGHCEPGEPDVIILKDGTPLHSTTGFRHF